MAAAAAASVVPDAPKRSTWKEIFVRFGSVINFGLQAVNVGLASVGPNKESFGSLSTTEQVGRGLIYGSSGIGAVNSPVVVAKERTLTNEDSLRAALDAINEQQQRLANENDTLSMEIDELESEVERLKDIEQALRELTATQGSQMDELISLIRENKEINQGMRNVLKARALEEVITLVLEIDSDVSWMIEKNEIYRLIVGMESIQDMVFDEEGQRFFREELMKVDGRVESVVELISNMLSNPFEDDDDYDEEEEGGGYHLQVADPETVLEQEKSRRQLSMGNMDMDQY